MSEKVDYEQAKKLGLKIYNVGKPCKYGHTIGYWISYRHCVLCDYIKRNINKAKKRVESISKIPSWYEYEIDFIKHIYKTSAEMTHNSDQFYHVDHIVPLKHKFVCGLHTVSNLQIITKSENQSKKNLFEV